MRDIAVVFDTNAYRDICDQNQVSDSAAELRKYVQCCNDRGISVFANPYVIMELASHLADASDPGFHECRCALVAQHTLCSTSDHKTIQILVDSETQMLRALYNKTLAASDQTTQKLCKLSLDVYENTPGTLDPKATQTCQEIKNHLESMEQQFVSDIWQYVVRGINPSSTGWVPLENDKATRNRVLTLLRSPTMSLMIAGAFVFKAMDQAGVQKSGSEFVEKAKLVNATCHVSIQLYQEILKRIVETGCNVEKKKRSNWIWDIQIAMGVGQQIGMANKTFHLITSDGDMLRAASDANCRQFVRSLHEFKAQTGIG